MVEMFEKRILYVIRTKLEQGITLYDMIYEISEFIVDKH